MKTQNFFAGLLMIAGILSFVGCQKEPTAAIDADKKTVETGETIQFKNTSADANSYLWDFGDNSSSTEAAPSKSYSTAGNYTVKMTAYSKNKKKTDEGTLSITVNNINKKFEGTYLMQSSACASNHSMTITSTGTNQIILSNLLETNSWGYGFSCSTFSATVTGSSFTLTSQSCYDDDGWYLFSGNGSLSGNNISVTTTVTYEDDLDPAYDYTYTCSETGTK